MNYFKKKLDLDISEDFDQNGGSLPFTGPLDESDQDTSLPSTSTLKDRGSQCVINERRGFHADHLSFSNFEGKKSTLKLLLPENPC